MKLSLMNLHCQTDLSQKTLQIYKTVLLSALCKIMLKPAGYYILFMLVALVVSYQIVSTIFNKDEEDDMNGEKE